MDITRAAIERNRITAIALLVVLVGGLSAYGRMSRAEDPGFVIRTAQVLTIFPGASPDRVENLVTDRLEEVIQEIPELDFVNSTSKTGVSIVMVNIREEFMQMRPIWDDLRRKVDKVRPELPADIVGPTVNDEFGDVFGVIVTLTGEGFSYAELKDVADEVRDELLRVNDVAKVEIHGAQEERVFVDYDNARLAELGLSPIQLRQILESANIIIPGGDVNTRDFHFGRPGLAPYTPKTFCLDRFAVAAHWACPLNRQRAVREGLAEQTAVVLGRFFDTSPTLRPVVAHGLVTPSAVNRPVRAALRSAGASPRTAAASDGSPPAGASSNERVSPAAHPS